ncbi:DUF1365 domain-containing protein [Paucibacter sp. PLA-PC-4]|uniref:DUF1365 domain-containing protein n=1 Tax=Paucibacter sp. PLA-PC-4 TaxID=2993655 RepID=UPI00224B574C|nr:DUF1365 domain-containing protein [Paucibacter sp. PLA-PC-4]MCX2863961.1 DUF1365 domain-containing protein [Paucibacter sp. PLA-PC-4]
MRTWPTQPLIGRGPVHHGRLRPRPHRFSYASYFLMLPMRKLSTNVCEALNRNSWGWLSFHDADHGDGGTDALAWLDRLLASEGITDADGEVWLHCFPRVLGYAFKPVSFWYCHRTDESLAAIVVEVNNTFGERHCYLLSGPEMAYGRELSAAKVFHVSPFCRVEGRYRFRFLHTGLRTVARIEHEDEQGPLLTTSISGQLQPLTNASARAAFFAHPAFSLMLMARIHWQALRLWLKRTPFFGKPAAPTQFLTR